VRTSKSSKKRVSSCPELWRHETGQQAITGSLNRGILTTNQSPRGGVRRKWRFAGTNPSEVSVETGRKVDTPYDRTAHTNANSKLHFILHSHPYGRDVFGCVCLRIVSGETPRGTVGAWRTHDNGQENKTDERLRDIEPGCGFFDRRDH
jgi:hypothetical protein